MFQDKQLQFNSYHNTSTALKNCILNAVDDEYIKNLKVKITRYATVSPLKLLTHLWDTYGEVTIVDLKSNEARMKVQWNPPSPIESLFLQLEYGQAFAAEGNETIENSILIRLGYDNIVETGQFSRYDSKWRKRLIATQTWTDFRTCFTEYYKERTESMTTEEASYSDNQVHEMIQSSIEQHMSDFCQHITDENSNPNITPSIAPPPQSANALTGADLSKLAKLLNPTWIPLKPKFYTGVAQGKDDKGRDITYCYSNGWTRNLDHDSKNCTRRVEGHNEKATLNNKMGGYDGAIKFRKNPRKKWLLGNTINKLSENLSKN